MNDNERGPEVEAGLEQSAGQPIDATDLAVLEEVARLLEHVDPVPDDLVERVRFAVALDEVMAEVAQITRMPVDSLAVRSDPASGTRTETLTFSAEHLTAMVTVTRSASGELRLDGWIAPESAMRVRLRMRDGTERGVEAESGRFVFEALPEGFAQLSFHPLDEAGGEPEHPEAVVVTPLFEL